MRRQRVRNVEYSELLEQNDGTDEFDQQSIHMQNQRQHRRRYENVLEAQIQPGDTLQAIALRYNCTISDLKRLNKIEKEIEIHARKTIKVPVNAHTILLNTTNSDVLPIVHKSGQSSPNRGDDIYSSSKDIHSIIDTSQQLSNSILDEKLLVASVSLASNNFERDKNGNSSTANTIHSNYRATVVNDKRMKLTSNADNAKNDDDEEDFNFTDPLITPLTESNELYTTTTTTTTTTLQSGPHAIRGAPRSEFACNGSDCDISWICLFIFILALCFAIPLIYVIYIAEHPEQFHHKESEAFVVG